MGTQIYGQFVIEYDGETMAETTSIEVMLDGDDQDVFTLLKGFAGQSSSPKKVVINLTDAIPDIDYWHTKVWNDCLTGRAVAARVWRVGDASSLSSKGFIRKPKLNSGVGKPSENSYEFHGEANRWV
jgi:hypothetical protein